MGSAAFPEQAANIREEGSNMSTMRREILMRKISFLGFLVAIAVFGVLTSATARAEDPAPGKTAKEVLFDGKSLEGWKSTEFFGAGEVAISDGMVVLNAGRSMTGITSTRKDLPTTNYELVYQAQRIKGSDFFAAATFPVGKSFITLVNGGWGSTVTGLSSLDGADASENDTTTFFKYQEKTWYKFRVWVTEERIRCWIDDEQVVDVEYLNRSVGTRLETYANQPLGFAAYETTGAIRGVAVRKLTPEELKATNAGGKADDPSS